MRLVRSVAAAGPGRYNPAMNDTPPNATDPQDAPDEPANPQAPRRLLRKLLKIGLFLFYVLVLLELGSRAYWTLKDRDENMHLPFFASADDWYAKFYERIPQSGIREARIDREDGQYDILLLGGSALDRVHRSLGDESQQMQEAFSSVLGQSVRVWNLASPGMTTRDSAIKYRILSQWSKVFDLVIVYHGINDVRMNNCPPEIFRDDYTQGAFYEQLRRMERSWWRTVFTLPYTIEYFVIHQMDSKTLDLGCFVPRHRLKEEWKQYGTDVKTRRTFRANLEDILARAEKHETPVLLSSFAWYIPADYSMAKLREGKLDYARFPAPSAVELWGTVPAVSAGLAVHNDVIADLARAHRQVLFLPGADVIGKDGSRFNDVCHLSEQGKKALLAAMVETLGESLDTPAGDPGE